MEILQSKFTNKNANKIWEEKAAAVSSVGVTARTTQEVREKWRNLQSTAIKERIQFRESRAEEDRWRPCPSKPFASKFKNYESVQRSPPSFTGSTGI